MDVGRIEAIEKNQSVGFQLIVLPIFFLTGIFFLNFTIRIILSPLMPTILKDMNLTPDVAGSFFLILASGFFISLSCSGFVSSLLGHKKTILLTSVGTGAAILFTGLSHDVWAIRLCIFFVGLASGIYLPSGVAILTSSVENKNWGKALGVHEMAPNLSFLLAPVICEVLLLWVSWRGVLMMVGAVSIGFGLLFYKFSTSADFHGEAPRLKSLKPLMSIPSIWMMMVLFSLGVTGTIGVYSMLPLYLVQVHGMVQSEANTLITLSRALTIPMSLIAGWLTDRVGIKWTLSSILFFSGISTLFIGVLSGKAMMVAIFFQPLFAVCFFPPAFAALSQICNAKVRNIAISLTIPVAFLMGSGVLPSLIGTLGKLGYFSEGFILFGCFILSGSMIPFFLKLIKKN